MELLVYYIAGSFAVAAVTFTVSITSITKGFREFVSSLHYKLEEFIHCPWCQSFWALLLLVNTWNVQVIDLYGIYLIDMVVTLFAMYSIVGLLHYVLLRSYKPVAEIMINRMKEKLQKQRKKNL